MIENAEMVQIALGLIAIGGIGGIWFRIGSLTATTTGLTDRVKALEDHVYHRVTP